MHFSSKRRFKMWDYNVSHKQLLLRSPTTPDIKGNLDIVFWQVEYIAIPTLIDGVTLADSTEADRMVIQSATGAELSLPLYRLDSGDRTYFIVAGGFKVLKNNLDICDSTLVDFALDRPKEWYGEVVAHS